MKTIQILFIILFSFTITFNTQAQKIKNKKDVTYFDKIPMFIIKGGSLIMGNNPAQIKSYQTGELLFVLTKHYYTYRGNSGYFYNELRMADFDISFDSSYDYKPLMKSLVENGVINSEGKIDKEKLEKYIRLYDFSLPPGAYF